MFVTMTYTPPDVGGVGFGESITKLEVGLLDVHLNLTAQEVVGTENIKQIEVLMGRVKAIEEYSLPTQTEWATLIKDVKDLGVAVTSREAKFDKGIRDLTDRIAKLEAPGVPPESGGARVAGSGGGPTVPPFVGIGSVPLGMITRLDRACAYSTCGYGVYWRADNAWEGGWHWSAGRGGFDITCEVVNAMLSIGSRPPATGDLLIPVADWGRFVRRGTALIKMMESGSLESFTQEHKRVTDSFVRIVRQLVDDE